jgi:tetratricopeptide (TPR) repeat protein
MMTLRHAVLAIPLAALLAPGADMTSARDRQDVAALRLAAADADAAAAKKTSDASAQFLLAQAQSTLAEVLLELGDKSGAQQAAEAGIHAARIAVKLQGNSPENHRLLGTLCGQAIPANVLLGLRYGRCASESIQKALELDPKSARAYLSKGVGNYYLPPAFGGGAETAIGDFEKAIELDPKLADAYLWLGIALRKAGKPAEARVAIQSSLKLNPNRVWAKQQIEKTPLK